MLDLPAGDSLCFPACPVVVVVSWRLKIAGCGSLESENEGGGSGVLGGVG